jgi:hypothetical protein
MPEATESVTKPGTRLRPTPKHAAITLASAPRRRRGRRCGLQTQIIPSPDGQAIRLSRGPARRSDGPAGPEAVRLAWQRPVRHAGSG